MFGKILAYRKRVGNKWRDYEGYIYILHKIYLNIYKDLTHTGLTRGGILQTIIAVLQIPDFVLC